MTVEIPYVADDSLIAATRESAIDAVTARIAWEASNGTNPDHIASITATLQTFRNHLREAPPISLAYAAVNGIDWHKRFLDSRVSGALMNVYSFRKLPRIMMACNGGSWDVGNGDDCTTAATVLAIVAKTNKGKATDNFINDACSRWGMGKTPGQYGAGQTQGGSSRRALHALGIINDRGSAIDVLREEDWKRLVSASKRLDKIKTAAFAGQR